MAFNRTTGELAYYRCISPAPALNTCSASLIEVGLGAARISDLARRAHPVVARVSRGPPPDSRWARTTPKELHQTAQLLDEHALRHRV
ncbi:hypothetical protein ACFWOY_21005 [Streptomyces sp. NPDC058423]|uniref:hypothetical protein n=1 Tax=unclassified Streptomyces TaxID=2593676 RepID=UPI0036465BAA